MDNISKYMIPLDQLDISFSLYNAFMKREKTVEERKNVDFGRNKNYYSDSGDTSDDCSDSSNDKININLNCICYICNVKVPDMFMKEHLDSPKHKTHLKIANTALSRLNKHINQNICLTKRSNSLYFCDICVIAVDDKMNHVLSDSHKIAVKKEKIFNSFVQLYTDDETIDCETNVDNERKVHKIRTNIRELNKSLLTSDEGSSNDESLDDKCTNIVKLKETMNPNNTLNKEITIKEQEAIKKQLKTINTIVKNHTLTSLDKKNYIIRTKEGVQIKVLRDNYHSFNKIGKRKYVCQLCSSFCQRKGTHILTEKHMKKVAAPIKDHHCIRQVDSTTIHCILCNELIENYLLHTMWNEKHIELLTYSIIDSDDESALINTSKPKVTLKHHITDVDRNSNENNDNDTLDGSRKTVSDVGSLRSTIQNTKLPSNKDSISIQNIPLNLSKTNVNNKKELKVDENIIPTNLSESNSNVIVKISDHPDFYMIKSRLEERSCYFCNVAIPNTLKNITEHLNGSRHKKTVSDILNNNGMILKNGKIYCEFCKSFMTKELQYYHLQLESHKDKINKSEIRTPQLVESETEKNNDVNTSKDIEVTNLNTEVIAQLANKIDTPNIVEEIDYNPTIMEKTPKGNEILCKICNNVVPLKNSNIQDHIAGNKHRTNVKELLEKNKIINKNSNTYCELCTINIKDELIFEHIQTYYHMKKLEIINRKDNESDVNFKQIKTVVTYILNMLDNGNLICKICNVSIPNKETNVTEHIEGRKHKFTETETFRKNKMVIKEINSYCEVCFLYIINGMEYVHIETTFHKENITKLNKTKAEHKNLEQNFGMVRKIPHYVHCTICDVDVPDSVNTVNMHVGGSKHKSKLKILFPNQ